MGGNKRGQRWATAAEIRGGPTKQTQASTQAWASDVASTQMNVEFPGLRRQKNTYPAGDSELADWEGNWVPAPVDWNDRPVFQDRRFHERIQEWIEQLDTNSANVPLKCDVEDLQAIDGEIACRAWIPSHVDGKSLDVWWRNHLKSPELCSQMHIPFWNAYISQFSPVLRKINVPDAKLDVTDNDMVRARQTAAQLILSRHNKQSRQVDQARKHRDRQQHLHQEAFKYIPPPNPHAPRANIYLRPAVVHDMSQITDIYEHYIHTLACPEIEPLSTAQVRDRWNDVVDNHLPFLVAVDRSSKGNRSRGVVGRGNEHIVGFVFADDYNDIRGMYRYAVEIDLFVKTEYLRHGIGRSLMDKIMSVLDPHYGARGGYDFIGDEAVYGCGGTRVVGTVIVNIPYDACDKSRLVWLQDWLAQFDFEQAGELFEIGYKLNTKVSLAIFTKKTGSTLEPWAQ